MEERILTIYESLLMTTGYARMELIDMSGSDEEIIPAQRVMVKLLSKILQTDEIRKITGFKGTEILAIVKMKLNEKERALYNLSWDLYVRMKRDQIKQKVKNGIIREFLNPFSSALNSGIY